MMEIKGNNEAYIETIYKLEQENSRLKHLAEIDWLTGLYNRGTIEQNINSYLKSGQPGTMFVFDLDYFKQVNDRYGHIIGDCLLQKIGDVLKKMYPRDSLIGRTGGDEFVVFLFGNHSEKTAENICTQLSERFRTIYLKNKLVVKLSMTIAWAKSADRISYKEIFDFADQKIVEKKQSRNAKNTRRYEECIMELEGIQLDMNLIAAEMGERKMTEGAYCQGYETFKGIYQLELRRMRRIQRDVYLILFTLLDKNNSFLALEERDKEMGVLGIGIQKNLRVGDVFTQYSSNQYLVMVTDANAANVEMISGRIRSAYYESHEGPVDHLMLYSSYPLNPKEK
ncbi:GGDEF domain-containing protein [Ruminococcus sp. OA3]|uniref:GGDEF domain-containing protein n=1 Tax=Ruminococcus sp. OA3 TaxID=2914164 RepID=UPI001F05353E|nr:GGDEF domain-containing protein [Ruminococcus sp. OA3]MCH1983271.1 GGDEF domain-containing protein [Ruminococcus sp. OA3]